MGVAIAIAAISTVVSIKNQREASKQARRAARAQRRAEKVRAAQRRREQLAESRRRRAEARNAEAVSGVNTSVAAGVQGSIQSQLASNLSFLNQLDTLSEQSFLANTRASRAESNALTAAAVADLSGRFANRRRSSTGTRDTG